MSATDSEEALFAGLRAKDERAFEQAYDAFAKRAYGLAYKLLSGDHEAAEEVVQEAFLAVWQQSERLDPKRGRFAPLILAIVHHKASDYLRRRKLDLRATTDLATGMPPRASIDPADVALAVIDRTALRDAFSSLPLKQRRTLQLAYFGGHSHSEIAREMREPLGTVKSRLRLALKQLHGLLRGRVR